MRPTSLFTLFYCAVLGMELSYLYILASLLSGPIYTRVLILLLYPTALLSRITLNRSALPHRLRFTLELTWVTLVILLVAVERLLSSLAAGQADFFGIILRMVFCGLTWLLGHTVSHEEMNYSSISFRLMIGVVAVLVFSQIAGSALPVFLFFLLVPLALFLTRWSSSLSRGAAVVHPLHPGHLFLAGASLMVPGMALILLLSPDVARAIVDWLRNILMKLSDWLMAQQQAAAKPPTDFKFDFSCNIRPESEGMPAPMPLPPPSDGTPGISPVVIWIIVFAILLAILVLIAFALKKRKTGRKARPIEPVRFQIRMVSLDMLRSLISLVPQLLKHLWLWLTSLFLRWKKRPKPSEDPLLSIRALYRNLLRWAARQGVARAPAQTPLEHLELLEQKFPLQQDDLKQITAAYLLARYSQKPISQEEFDSAKKAWQRAVAYHTPSRVRT